MNTTTKPINLANLIKYIKIEAPKDGSVKDISSPNPIVYSDFGPARLQAYIFSPPDESLVACSTSSSGPYPRIRLHVTVQSVTGKFLTEFYSGKFQGDPPYGLSLTSQNRDILCQMGDGTLEPLQGKFVVGNETDDFELPSADVIRDHKDNFKLNVDDNFYSASLIPFRFGAASDYELILKFLAAKGI